ncbi:unnamed protein product [Taenia asiatica]|uniref:Protein kinase domain-containing protein n=1 Tax=Taenia asiatica TaxID=60517 RepID=A0A0R3W0F3_TAEAS|nr:unnamed protein product [Taenia asiatica]
MQALIHLATYKLVKEQSFMYQMLQALRYCHVRRDLKPQNVLVDVNRSVVKLADLGMAKSFGYPPREIRCLAVTLRLTNSTKYFE